MVNFTVSRLFQGVRLVKGVDNFQFLVEGLIYLMMVFGVFGFEFCAVAYLAGFKCWNISAIAVSISTIVTILTISYSGFMETCSYRILRNFMNVFMAYAYIALMAYIAGIFYTCYLGVTYNHVMFIDTILLIIVLAIKFVGGANFVVLFSNIHVGSE